jgi:hypothetical protein
LLLLFWVILGSATFDTSLQSLLSSEFDVVDCAWTEADDVLAVFIFFSSVLDAVLFKSDMRSSTACDTVEKELLLLAAICDDLVLVFVVVVVVPVVELVNSSSLLDVVFSAVAAEFSELLVRSCSLI